MRFSISTLLVLTALLAVAITVATSWPVHQTVWADTTDAYADSAKSQEHHYSRPPLQKEIIGRLAWGLPAVFMLWYASSRLLTRCRGRHA